MHVDQTFTFLFEAPSSGDTDSPIADFEATYRVVPGAPAALNCPPESHAIEILAIHRLAGEERIAIDEARQADLAEQLCENEDLLIDLASEALEEAALDAGP